MKATMLCSLLCLSLFAFVCEGAKDYADALGKSILFYDAQRSGKLPDNNPIAWRGDSALDDCVPGGWYDAGDTVKFGLPFGGSVTLLGWSLVEFKDGYATAGQLDMMYDMIKWAYDWALNAWDPVNQQLVVQIGDPEIEHDYWGRPEDITHNRTCYTVDFNQAASNIAAGYVSALTTGSLAFRDKGDAAYADQLLNAAKSLYTFAKSHRGVYPDDEYYDDSDDKDNLCEAAMWLYKATGEDQYQNDARWQFLDNSPLYGDLGWEDRMPACKVLLLEASGDSQLRNELENYFVNGWVQGNIIDYTPCGLAFRTRWGSIAAAANTAFLALIAAEQGIQPTTLRQWAVEQINFVLGDNNHDGGCYSYEIGYGSKYPLQPHHAAASCPDPPAGCDWDAFDSLSPNPHILMGGVVAGPDENDNYIDDRSDYVLNEVALDYNAGVQGALAGIMHLVATNSLPSTNNKCPCNE